MHHHRAAVILSFLLLIVLLLLHTSYEATFVNALITRNCAGAPKKINLIDETFTDDLKIGNSLDCQVTIRRTTAHSIRFEEVLSPPGFLNIEDLTCTGTSSSVFCIRFTAEMRANISIDGAVWTTPASDPTKQQYAFIRFESPLMQPSSGTTPISIQLRNITATVDAMTRSNLAMSVDFVDAWDNIQLGLSEILFEDITFNVKGVVSNNNQVLSRIFEPSSDNAKSTQINSLTFRRIRHEVGDLTTTTNNNGRARVVTMQSYTALQINKELVMHDITIVTGELTSGKAEVEVMLFRQHNNVDIISTGTFKIDIRDVVVNVSKITADKWCYVNVIYIGKGVSGMALLNMSNVTVNLQDSVTTNTDIFGYTAVSLPGTVTAPGTKVAQYLITDVALNGGAHIAISSSANTALIGVFFGVSLMNFKEMVMTNVRYQNFTSTEEKAQFTATLLSVVDAIKNGERITIDGGGIFNNVTAASVPAATAQILQGGTGAFSEIDGVVLLRNTKIDVTLGSKNNYVRASTLTVQASTFDVGAYVLRGNEVRCTATKIAPSGGAPVGVTIARFDGTVNNIRGVDTGFEKYRGILFFNNTLTTIATDLAQTLENAVSRIVRFQAEVSNVDEINAINNTIVGRYKDFVQLRINVLYFQNRVLQGMTNGISINGTIVDVVASSSDTGSNGGVALLRMIAPVANVPLLRVHDTTVVAGSSLTMMTGAFFGAMSLAKSINVNDVYKNISRIVVSSFKMMGSTTTSHSPSLVIDTSDGSGNATFCLAQLEARVENVGSFEFYDNNLTSEAVQQEQQQQSAAAVNISAYETAIFAGIHFKDITVKNVGALFVAGFTADIGRLNSATDSTRAALVLFDQKVTNLTYTSPTTATVQTALNNGAGGVRFDNVTIAVRESRTSKETRLALLRCESTIEAVAPIVAQDFDMRAVGFVSSTRKASLEALSFADQIDAGPAGGPSSSSSAELWPITARRGVMTLRAAKADNSVYVRAIELEGKVSQYTRISVAYVSVYVSDSDTTNGNFHADLIYAAEPVGKLRNLTVMYSKVVVGVRPPAEEEEGGSSGSSNKVRASTIVFVSIVTLSSTLSKIGAVVLYRNSVDVVNAESTTSSLLVSVLRAKANVADITNESLTEDLTAYGFHIEQNHLFVANSTSLTATSSLKLVRFEGQVRRAQAITLLHNTMRAINITSSTQTVVFMMQFQSRVGNIETPEQASLPASSLSLIGRDGEQYVWRGGVSLVNNSIELQAVRSGTAAVSSAIIYVTDTAEEIPRGGFSLHGNALRVTGDVRSTSSAVVLSEVHYVSVIPSSVRALTSSGFSYVHEQGVVRGTYVTIVTVDFKSISADATSSPADGISITNVVFSTISRDQTTTKLQSDSAHVAALVLRAYHPIGNFTSSSSAGFVMSNVSVTVAASDAASFCVVNAVAMSQSISNVSHIKLNNVSITTSGAVVARSSYVSIVVFAVTKPITDVPNGVTMSGLSITLGDDVTSDTSHLATYLVGILGLQRVAGDGFVLEDSTVTINKTMRSKTSFVVLVGSNMNTGDIIDVPTLLFSNIAIVGGVGGLTNVSAYLQLSISMITFGTDMNLANISNILITYVLVDRLPHLYSATSSIGVYGFFSTPLIAVNNVFAIKHVRIALNNIDSQRSASLIGAQTNRIEGGSLFRVHNVSIVVAPAAAASSSSKFHACQSPIETSDALRATILLVLGETVAGTGEELAISNISGRGLEVTQCSINLTTTSDSPVECTRGMVAVVAVQIPKAIRDVARFHINGTLVVVGSAKTTIANLTGKGSIDITAIRFEKHVMNFLGGWGDLVISGTTVQVRTLMGAGYVGVFGLRFAKSSGVGWNFLLQNIRRVVFSDFNISVLDAANSSSSNVVVSAMHVDHATILLENVSRVDVSRGTVSVRMMALWVSLADQQPGAMWLGVLYCGATLTNVSDMIIVRDVAVKNSRGDVLATTSPATTSTTTFVVRVVQISSPGNITDVRKIRVENASIVDVHVASTTRPELLDSMLEIIRIPGTIRFGIVKPFAQGRVYEVSTVNSRITFTPNSSLLISSGSRPTDSLTRMVMMRLSSIIYNDRIRPGAGIEEKLADQVFVSSISNTLLLPSSPSSSTAAEHDDYYQGTASCGVTLRGDPDEFNVGASNLLGSQSQLGRYEVSVNGCRLGSAASSSNNVCSASRCQLVALDTVGSPANKTQYFVQNFSLEGNVIEREVSAALFGSSLHMQPSYFSRDSRVYFKNNRIHSRQNSTVLLQKPAELTPPQNETDLRGSRWIIDCPNWWEYNLQREFERKFSSTSRLTVVPCAQVWRNTVTQSLSQESGSPTLGTATRSKFDIPTPTRSRTLVVTLTISDPPSSSSARTQSSSLEQKDPTATRSATQSGTATVARNSQTPQMTHTLSRSRGTATSSVSDVAVINNQPAAEVEAEPASVAVVDTVATGASVGSALGSASAMKSLSILSVGAKLCAGDGKTAGPPPRLFFPQSTLPRWFIGGDPGSQLLNDTVLAQLPLVDRRQRVITLRALPQHRAAIVANLVLCPIVIVSLFIAGYYVVQMFEKYYMKKDRSLHPFVVAKRAAAAGRVMQALAFALEGIVASSVFLILEEQSTGGDRAGAVVALVVTAVIFIVAFIMLRRRFLRHRMKYVEAAVRPKKGEAEELGWWRLVLGDGVWVENPDHALQKEEQRAAQQHQQQTQGGHAVDDGISIGVPLLQDAGDAAGTNNSSSNNNVAGGSGQPQQQQPSSIRSGASRMLITLYKKVGIVETSEVTKRVQNSTFFRARFLLVPYYYFVDATLVVWLAVVRGSLLAMPCSWPGWMVFACCGCALSLLLCLGLRPFSSIIRQILATFGECLVFVAVVMLISGVESDAVSGMIVTGVSVSTLGLFMCTTVQEFRLKIQGYELVSKEEVIRKTTQIDVLMDLRELQNNSGGASGGGGEGGGGDLFADVLAFLNGEDPSQQENNNNAADDIDLSLVLLDDDPQQQDEVNSVDTEAFSPQNEGEADPDIDLNQALDDDDDDDCKDDTAEEENNNTDQYTSAVADALHAGGEYEADPNQKTRRLLDELEMQDDHLLKKNTGNKKKPSAEAVKDSNQMKTLFKKMANE